MTNRVRVFKLSHLVRHNYAEEDIRGFWFGHRVEKSGHILKQYQTEADFEWILAYRFVQ